MGMSGLESFHHPGKNLVLGIKVSIKKTCCKIVFAAGLFGSPCWTRTNDSLINSQVLYRLS